MRKMEPSDLDCYEKEIRKAVESFTLPGLSGSDSTFEEPLDGSDPFDGTLEDSFDMESGEGLVSDEGPVEDDVFFDEGSLSFDTSIEADGS